MYSKQTWKNGDVITEDKLNHMEEGISTGGGIYTYEEVALFDGEVVTAKQSEDASYAYEDITLQGDLPKSEINVTFNGQDYTLPYGSADRYEYWGEVGSDNMPSFANIPLNIVASRGGVAVATAEEGTYSLKINETVGKIELSDLFNKDFLVNVGLAVGGLVLDKTYSQIYEAYAKHKNVRFIYNYDGFFEFHMAGLTQSSIVLFHSVYNSNTWSAEYSEFKYTTTDGYPTTVNAPLE